MPQPSGRSPRSRPAIRQGGIYFVRNCPLLDDPRDSDKDRWVIVVDDAASLKAGADPVVVVACSASVHETEVDRIRLPSQADTPNCRTGLPRQCWAVPRWYFPVERTRLTDYRGYLSGHRLKDVIRAYLIRDEEAQRKEP